MTQVDKNYLERPYLTDSYLLSGAEKSAGLQMLFVRKKPTGLQTQVKIVDRPKPTGFQFLTIINGKEPSGLQFQGLIDFVKPEGVQFEGTIASSQDVGVQTQMISEGGNNAQGMQLHTQIVDLPQPTGIQSLTAVESSKSTGFQTQCLVESPVSTGLQFQAIFQDSPRVAGMQFQAEIRDFLQIVGLQLHAQIEDQTSARGIQLKAGSFVHRCFLPGFGFLEQDFLTSPFLAQVCEVSAPIQFEYTPSNNPNKTGMQTLARINAAKPMGIQAQFQVADSEKPTGFQLQLITLKSTGLQWRSVLYNTNRLRVLCDFASRGVDGLNWTASSEATVDYEANNVNTDIIEQTYRSVGRTGVVLTCDTQVSQGTFLDTLAILGHNMTTSANVLIQGSNDPAFGTVGTSISLAQAEKNTYYISPDLPAASYRYWRISIDDPTNSDNYIEIGAILFGSATIFSGECFANPIRIQRQAFSQSVTTEAYTTVTNDRAIRRRVSLDFRNINFSGGNYENLVNIFETRRTTHKCLWIPDPRYPSRYAVFGKLTEIPEEEHQDNGLDNDYVSFSVEIDEAK